MRRVLVAVFLGILPLVAAPQGAWAISYGEPDNGEHPNVAALVAVLTDAQTGVTTRQRFCTGTLIDRDMVLTASHCFAGVAAELPGASIYVTFADVIDADGDQFVDESVELLSGTPHSHPLFGSGGQNDPHDIAVFELDAPARETPATLPEAGLLDDHSLRAETFTAVGYGLVRETNRKAYQSILPSYRRMQADQHINSVTKAWVTFSMNLATGNGGSCYGDSGGPHFLGEVVVALTVTGDSVCKATDTSYRIDTAPARAFLAQYVTLP